jgi:MFS family permease
MTTLTTAIPGRLDGLKWSRFHALVLTALGVSWMLDGLEVTIVGAMGGVLENQHTLGLSATDVGAVASCYIAGAVLGALAFGWLTDRYGRRRIFFITLGAYILGVGLSACSWNFLSFAIFRAVTGFGIGGEYAAVNSAIDELVPKRIRGQLNLAINGTYWLGAAIGAGATIFLLNTAYFGVDVGWRLGFGIGGVLGLGVILLRNIVPESPRWLITHGYEQQANASMDEIERRVGAPGPTDKTITLHPKKSFGFGIIFKIMLGEYRARSFLVLVLMAAQAFLYNALFFTYALVLVKFYGVPAAGAGIYLLPLAAGNFLGPVLLGRLFDTIGRRRMVAATYFIAGVLLAATGYLFATGRLNAATQTGAWVAIFFFASAAASAAYLTASEIFPLEMRAMAIAVFYALGTALGGIAGPLLFGRLIGSGSRWHIFDGYLFAAAFMLLAAGVAWRLGIDAQNKSLEEIAPPLST